MHDDIDEVKEEIKRRLEAIAKENTDEDIS